MDRRRSVAKGDNKGTRYEILINRILEEKLHYRSTPAKSSDKPDAFFPFNGTYHALEIKGDLSADFAQVELEWAPKAGFTYSGKSRNKKYIQVLEKEDFLSEVNQYWTGIPKRHTVGQGDGKNRAYDQDNFLDRRRGCPNAIRLIESFYNLKDIPRYYMQIGGKGFYYLGSNPLGLIASPLNGKGVLRARVKTRSKSKNTWGFLVAIKVSGVKPSISDIEEKDGRVFPFSSNNVATTEAPPGTLLDYFKK